MRRQPLLVSFRWLQPGAVSTRSRRAGCAHSPLSETSTTTPSGACTRCCCERPASRSLAVSERAPAAAQTISMDDHGWAQLLDDRYAAPETQAEAGELIGAVRDAIAEVLTSHQRAVLVAIALKRGSHRRARRAPTHH